MAIDDLLDRARDARRRHDEAAGERVALLRALEGLEGMGCSTAHSAGSSGDCVSVRDRSRARRAKSNARAGES